MLIETVFSLLSQGGQIIEKKKIDKNKSVWLVRVQTRHNEGKLKSRSATVRGNQTDADKKLTNFYLKKTMALSRPQIKRLANFLTLGF
jgi:hypothetical protein